MNLRAPYLRRWRYYRSPDARPAGGAAGFVAATNAVLGPTMPLGDEVTTTGSFTEREYAQTGLSEAKARATHEIMTAVVHFDSTTRT